IALTFGVYALGLFVLILIWTPIRLIIFGLKLPGDSPAASAGYSLLAIYAIIAVACATCWLGAQTEILFFLITALSDRLVLGQHSDPLSVNSALEMPPLSAFRRVMI